MKFTPRFEGHEDWGGTWYDDDGNEVFPHDHPYKLMTPRTAAKMVYLKTHRNHEPQKVEASWLEGRHMPVGTFGEFVRELKGFGLAIESYATGKYVTVCGCD